MGEATEDRRVRRTKSRLKTAILELVREKSYGRITIREITDRADVGRSTFYSHFDSKEDLLFSGFDDWLLSLASSADGPAEGPEEEPEGFRFSLPLLRHARSQRRFVEAVVVAGGSAGVRRRLTALLAEVARRELQRRGRGERHDHRATDARAHAVAGAFVGVLGWWLEGGLEAGKGLTPEAVDRAFQAAVAPPS